METKYLNSDDKRRIAHFLAERAVQKMSTRFTTEEEVRKYVETFNSVIKMID